MVGENPTWGAPRIHGELLMLGFDVSERTIPRWMRRAPRDPEPPKRWLAFLHNHRKAIAAMDFFSVPTITFGVLYGFFVISFFLGPLLSTVLTMSVAVDGPAQSYSLPHVGVFDLFSEGSDFCWAVVIRDVMNSKRTAYMARTSINNEKWDVWHPSVPVSHIFFLNNKEGWGLTGAADKTSFARTTDGGLTWQLLRPFNQIPFRDSNIVDFRFQDSKSGWIIATLPAGSTQTGQITDGGNNVHVVQNVSNQYGIVRSISVTDARVWLFGTGSILYSEDHGDSWHQQLTVANFSTNPNSLTIEEGSVGSDGHGVAVGGAGSGIVLITNNYGKHWTISLIAKEETSFMSGSFWTSENGCVVGNLPVLYCTSDEGGTWTTRGTLPALAAGSSSEVPAYKKLVFLRGGQRGWVLTADWRLFETSDGGWTWHEPHLLDQVR